LSPPNTCGSSASGGSGGSALRRDTTSSITRVMLVPTSKVSPTPPPPRLDCERICTSPGRPRMACSTGSISTSSTSAGAASRQPTLIHNCGRVVSGSSWIGSLSRARAPNSSTTRLAAAMAGGFFRQNWVRRMRAPRERRPRGLDA
jgi:hypothetical protein